MKITPRKIPVCLAVHGLMTGVAAALVAAQTLQAQQPKDRILIKKPEKGHIRTARAQLTYLGRPKVKDRPVYDRAETGVLALPILRAALRQGQHKPIDARVLVKLRPGGTLIACCGVPILGPDKAPVLFSAWVPLKAGNGEPDEVSDKVLVSLGEVDPGDYDVSIEIVEPTTIADPKAYRDGEQLWRRTSYSQNGITVS
jgi:hypothetical protein